MMTLEKVNSEQGVSLSERERSVVEEIESLPMSDPDRTNLLLVWRGLKPATDFRVRLWEGTSEGKEEAQKLIQNADKFRQTTTTLLKEMGLSFVEDENNPVYSVYEYGEKEEPTEKRAAYELLFYASRDKALAEKLYHLWSKDEHETYKELGRLFGFPETAIRAYGKFFSGDKRIPLLDIKDAFMEQEDLPEEIRRQDFVAFAQFRLSRENWREELETAKRWAEEIKKIDPILYQRTVERYKKELTKSYTQK